MTEWHPLFSIKSDDPPPYTAGAGASRARRVNPDLNTLEQAIGFAQVYAAEIRQDAKSRRVYRSFLALTENQFEALLAFALWKVCGLSFNL